MSRSHRVQTRSGGEIARAWLAWALFALTILCLAGALISRLGSPMPVQSVPVRIAFSAFAFVGLLIALRRPGNALGWLCLEIGLANSAQLFLDQYVWSMLTGKVDGLLAPEWIALFDTQVLTGVGWISLFLVPMLFPTGRFLSRRWRLAGLGATGLTLLLAFGDVFGRPTLPGYAFPIRNPLWSVPLAHVSHVLVPILTVPNLPLLFGSMILPPILRYRRAPSQERQQLKWLVFAMLLWVIFSTLATLQLVANSPLLEAFITVWNPICIAAIPVTIAIALLRYRLYDIDVIIRRTLVYSILTALLAGVYFGGVVVLQQAFRPMVGPQNDLALVASTLGIAALMQPLRRRVQAFIDRRFYRRKYDAATTLAAFSARLRDEVELDRLTGDLLAVVEETLQPAHLSLWLPSAEGSATARGEAQPHFERP